jgi:hypothetical protein
MQLVKSGAVLSARLTHLLSPAGIQPFLTRQLAQCLGGIPPSLKHFVDTLFWCVSCDSYNKQRSFIFMALSD